MFCHEVKKALMAYVKIGDIKKASPLPLANISCYNQDYYEAQIENISIEAVIKSSVLFVLALATILFNLIFVLVIRSAKYQRRVQVQVTFKILFQSSWKISPLFSVSILHYCHFLQLYSKWLLCYDVCNLHWGSQLLAIWWNHLPSTSQYPKYNKKWILENTYLNTFQTILFGALNQHFCILIMSMGLDRYFSLAYPHKYGRIFSAKVSSFF